jgi:phosphate transport system permease protein
MTSTLTARDSEAERPLHSHGEAGDVWVDRTFRGLTLVAGLAVLAILALIAYSTTTEAWPAFQKEGLSFITSDDWAPAQGKFGALAFIYGTLLTSLIAIIIAMPISLGIALFTTEVAPRRMRRPIIYVIDLLAAIPSVVYGLWGFAVFAPWVMPKYQSVADAVNGIPILNTLFGGVAQGRSFMTAGIVLAFMITPIITALSRETLSTVAQDDKNAALAMGATRWEMIRVAIFPRVRSGILAAVMLGLGRAMGETIAVALIIGSVPQITLHLFSSGDAMAAVIANQFGEASGDHRAALIGLGVVLFGITILVNIVARYIMRVAERRANGGARA